ncbi:hypothetical protein ACLOJK_014091 [Asimina triloba]
MARTGSFTSSVPTSSSKGKRKVVDNTPSLIQKRLRPRRLQSGVKIDDRPVNVDSPSSSSSNDSLPSPLCFSPSPTSQTEKVKSKPPRWVKKRSQAPSHPSAPHSGVNVDDFLMDPDDTMGGAGPSSGKTGGTDDVANAGHSESTPGGVPFSTPSTATFRPTMSSAFRLYWYDGNIFIQSYRNYAN